ncbi:hypothetical protein MMC07_005789 [Pseudocyphellaria aurata]|nr:hypothetical protein [Pseudocyphellaria aurata]
MTDRASKAVKHSIYIIPTLFAGDLVFQPPSSVASLRGPEKLKIGLEALLITEALAYQALNPVLEVKNWRAKRETFITEQGPMTPSESFMFYLAEYFHRELDWDQSSQLFMT